MSKKKKTAKPKKPDPKAILLRCDDKEKREAFMAQTILRPSIQAAATIKAYNSKDDMININALIAELTIQMQAVQGGDLKRAESILIAQAHTLDALFGDLMRRTVGDMSMEKFKIYFTLGLKAQQQCARSIEILGNLKNPAPYIQNNKAQYQQVNNGQSTPAPHAPAEENSKSSNKILEDKRHETEWLDTGAPEAAGRNDKAMETVGTNHRAENAGRKEKGKPERQEARHEKPRNDAVKANSKTAKKPFG